jgi:hypothetical protein
MAYVPDATNVAEPTIGREVRSAAEEFRTVKVALDGVGDDVTLLEGRVGTLENQMDSIATGTDSVALAVALASTSTGNGASMIGVEDALNWFDAVVTKTGESILGFVGKWLWGRDINVFQYLSVAQIASVKAYNFSVETQPELQQALLDAWAQKRDVFCPAGGYKIDAASLVLPGTRPTPEERAKAIRLYGQGYGNPFSSLNNGGTVFKSISNRPVVTDNTIPTLPDINGVVASAPTVSPDAQGSIYFDHIRVDATSNAGVPAVLLNSASGIGEYHHFVIFQRGVGDGLYVGYGATVHFHDFYTYNSQFVTTGLGAARTGVGVNFPNSYGAGLVTYSKCSSRGWHDCYIIGRDVNYAEAIAAGKDVTAFHTTLRDFECSTFYNGVTLATKTSNCTVDEGYFEGGETGTCIEDRGVFNQITHNQIFAGFTTGIKLSAGSGYGGVCAWNEIATAALPNVTCIDVTGNLGLGRSVIDNILVWGSSGGTIAGVAGIKISGANPQLNLGGNMFNPKINWVGGAGSAQIVDNSTSTLSAGSGVYGLGTASFDNLQIPMLNQGGISLAKGATNITAAPAGVVTLTQASSHVIAFAGALPITSFTAPNIEGKYFIVRCTNNNATFTNGANLKMLNGVNYTPPVNGATLVFIMHSNVAWEVSRTPY